MMSSNGSLNFSIVIASYRRPGMLRDTVHSLRALDIPAGVHCEVLLIDNDPDGSARELASELAAECEGFAMRYVHETRTGLSYARNRGIEEACGDVIAFLDDDMFVDPGWLRAILDCMQRTGACVVGGRTVVRWEDPPDPLVRRCAPELLNLDYGGEEFRMRGRLLPGGGNSAFRREVFADGLRFSTSLGRVGDVLLSGEDTLMFLTLCDAGRQLWYCGRAAVQHRTAGERTTLAYLRRQKYWFGISYSLIDRMRRGRTYQLGRAIARAAKALVVDVPRFVGGGIAGNRGMQFVAECSLRRQLGYWRAIVAPVETSGSCAQAATSIRSQTPTSVPKLRRRLVPKLRHRLVPKLRLGAPTAKLRFARWRSRFVRRAKQSFATCVPKQSLGTRVESFATCVPKQSLGMRVECVPKQSLGTRVELGSGTSVLTRVVMQSEQLVGGGRR